MGSWCVSLAVWLRPGIWPLASGIWPLAVIRKSNARCVSNISACMGLCLPLSERCLLDLGWGRLNRWFRTGLTNYKFVHNNGAAVGNCNNSIRYEQFLVQLQSISWCSWWWLWYDTPVIRDPL